MTRIQCSVVIISKNKFCVGFSTSYGMKEEVCVCWPFMGSLLIFILSSILIKQSCCTQHPGYRAFILCLFKVSLVQCYDRWNKTFPSPSSPSWKFHKNADFYFVGAPSSEIVQKLEHKLLSKYDKSVIPKTTLESGVTVTLDLALNQLIDVVSLSVWNWKFE